MGESCTVLDDLIKSDKFRDFGIHVSRNCFGGLLSGKRRVIIIPPPSEQKKLFAMSGQKAIEAIKQLIIPRPGKTVTVEELAKKGELVAINGTAVYPMTVSKIGDAKIVETHSSRNGLIIVVDKMPTSTGTRDVKGEKSDKPKPAPKSKSAANTLGGKKKKKVMRGGMRGGTISIDIELSDNDLRSEVVTVYKNKFGGGRYSYPWYYYLYGNVLSYLSATDTAAYLKYYWLIKMDPYAAVGGFLMPFIKKRNYQYYPLSDVVIKNWSRSSWWCNPSIKTGFSYAVYGGMKHDANMHGGTIRITFSNYFDKISAAYNKLRVWIKTKGRNCDKLKKMSKIQKFFRSASSTESEYSLYKELPEDEKWKAYFYFALYDYVCKHRSQFKSGLTLNHLVDRMFSNMEDVFENAAAEFTDASPGQISGIEKFVDHIGQYILHESELKEKLASVHDPNGAQPAFDPAVVDYATQQGVAARDAINNAPVPVASTSSRPLKYMPPPGSTPTEFVIANDELVMIQSANPAIYYGYKGDITYEIKIVDGEPKSIKYRDESKNKGGLFAPISGKLPYNINYIPNNSSSMAFRQIYFTELTNRVGTKEAPKVGGAWKSHRKMHGGKKRKPAAKKSAASKRKPKSKKKSAKKSTKH